MFNSLRKLLHKNKWVFYNLSHDLKNNAKRSFWWQNPHKISVNSVNNIPVKFTMMC